ncbi:PAS domain-containing sensor histidine kinase [Bacillus sp. MUM 116]|uniref:PAS domain-containing sensor histidine kinase n=1 Tax=Bacillus sp. MUM 116 TaxID=1678002 RepID=UPI0008F5858D|nr:PAS domain S-box protein [Bacillus sp. MUM 116]OIK16492.1 PAS domain-containing sensor histidine kinase [Bacillus sp. MUM 116]
MLIGIPFFGKENESVVYNPGELIDLFLNCTADGFAIFDMENRFIRVNSMYTQIFGYTEEDVIGRSFDEFPHFDLVKGIFDEVKQGKSYTNMITQRFHKNGTVLDISITYSPFRNSDGDIFAILASYRDITNMKTMEKELKRARELYKLIAENTTDMIKVYSKNYDILYASPSHEKRMGYTTEQLVGLSIFDLILPEEFADFKKMFQRVEETGESQVFQVKFKTSTDATIHIETNISPIVNDKKEIEFYVTVGRDITERVNNDTAFRNLDRLSIIGQLAAGVAHEIRNPLTSLKGFSKLLRSTANTEKQNQYLSIVMNELDRIDMIVNEFMSLAKPQAIQFERAQLTSILDSTINVLHPQALLYGVEMKINYPTEEVEILCSPHQLKQVFVNFLKNAMEAMPKGGTVHINVKKVDHNRVEICFIDEGVGIEQERLNYLGTPFYTTKEKGIGLGLTVSNKIIQEHRGTMKIESQIGVGTTVIVELQCQ